MRARTGARIEAILEAEVVLGINQSVRLLLQQGLNRERVGNRPGRAHHADPATAVQQWVITHEVVQHALDDGAQEWMARGGNDMPLLEFTASRGDFRIESAALEFLS